MKVCRVVSGVLVDDKGQILMGKRPMGKKRGGLWELPGGKVDEFEAPTDALAREWKEELDLTVGVWEFIASGHLEMEIPIFIDLYEVRATSPTFTLKNNDHSELTWIDAAHAMEYWPCSPAYYLHYPWLARWLKGRK